MARAAHVVGLALVLALGLAGGPCQAQWWAKVLQAADGAAPAAAAKVGAKSAAAAAATAELSHVAALLGRSSRLRSVERAGSQWLLVDGQGARAVIGVVLANGTTTLTDDALRLLAEVELVVTKSQLIEFEPLIKQALALRDDAVRLVRADDRSVALRRVGNQWVAEDRPGIFFPVAEQQSASLAALLERPFDRSSTRVVSLFDDSDADVLRALDDATGELHQPAGLMSQQEIRKLLAAGHQRTVMLVGHVEGGSFVVRNAAGQVRNRFLIADLEAAAAQAESTLLLLGCGAGAAGRSAGFVGAVNASNVAKSLGAALDHSTLGEALSALARGSGDFVLRPGLEDALRAQWQFESLASQPGHGVVRPAAILAPSAVRHAELQARVIPGIPSQWQLLYAVGWVVLLVCGRGVWRRWRPTWRPAPSFRRQPATFAAVHGTRYGSFVLLMPLVCLALLALGVATWVLALLSVGWSLPAAALGGYFGHLWYRGHKDLVAEQFWFLRWLAFPLFVIALAAPVHGLMHLADLWAGTHLSAAGWSVGLGWLATQAIVAWALGQLITRWLPARRWVPSQWFQWLLDAPLAGIERAAAGWWWTRRAASAD